MTQFCGMQNATSNVIIIDLIIIDYYHDLNIDTNVVSDLDGRAPQGHSKRFTLTGIQSEAPARLKLHKMYKEMRKKVSDKTQ